MKIRALVLLLVSLYSLSAFAQNTWSVKGFVADTVSFISLKNAAVTVLNSKDSTLVKFVWTKADGSFLINNLSKGNFILLITRPGYADYVEQFNLDSIKQSRDFGKLRLITKARLLAEVVISKATIVIKGDTTEFNQKSFVVQPNFKVEDLLKQLPGISVDKNGSITAQGKPVSKVLLDGEEFFSDDPTLVTRNIRGDMVEKFQLYDKKSDQATFSGIDDGVREKTINVVLKEDKKQGYFGKVSAGEGPNKYYQDQGMLNVFKASKRLSVYGTTSNTGKTGLGYDDGSKYGTGIGDDIEGGVEGVYEAGGIPIARTGGVHFDSKWNKNTQSLNMDYKIGVLKTNGLTNSLDQQNLSADIIKRNTDVSNTNHVFRQRASFIYQAQLNPSSNLRLNMIGSLRDKNGSLHENVTGIKDNSALYRNHRNLSDDTDQDGLTTYFSWSKRFKKPGRTISLSSSYILSKNESAGFLNSANELYNTSGMIYDTLRVDQYKTNKGWNLIQNNSLSYTEQLTKTLNLGLTYSLSLNNSSNDKRSFNRAASGIYNIPDPEYSNNLDLHQMSHGPGLSLSYKKNKATFSTVTNLSSKSQNQIDNVTATKFKRNFINLNQRIQYAYSFSQQRSLGIGYNGSTTQPDINQIQPIKANDDPLFITLGNPDLKPTFTSNFNFNYTSTKVLSNTYLYLFGGIGFTPDPIGSSIITDSQGKRTSQAINIAGKTKIDYSMYLTVGKTLKESKTRLTLNLHEYGQTIFDFQNNALNKTKSIGSDLTLRVSKDKADKYSFAVSFGPGYITNKSTLQPLVNINRWAFASSVDFTLYLPGKFEISADGTYKYTEKSQSFGQTVNPFILNSSIGKKLLKTKSLLVAVTGNDLFKQNTVFTASGFRQTNTNTIQRYFMGSITWDFSRMHGAKTQK